MIMKKQVMVDCNLYVGKNNCFATASEVVTPEIKYKTIEHSSIASVGTVDLPTGKLEKMEAKITLTGFSEEVFSDTANPFKSVELIVYGNLMKYDGDEVTENKPAKLYMTCSTSSFKPLGDKKEHDNVVQEITLTPSAVKLEVNGKALFEVDIDNNILKVGGKDLRSEINANLGL